MTSAIKKVVRCSCGLEFRGGLEGHLIQAVKYHAKGAHDLTFTDEQVIAMMEVDQ